MNTTTANASVAVNVGGNVVVNTSTIAVGNALANATLTTSGQYLVRKEDGVSSSLSVSRLQLFRSYVDGGNNRRDRTEVTNTNLLIVVGEDPFDTNTFTAKIFANTSSLRVANGTVNTEMSIGQVRVGANVVADTTRLYVGNATVNSVTSQASFVAQNTIHSATLTQTGLSVGNSTINAVSNSTLITIANSAGQANLSPIDLKVGITTVNSTAVGISTIGASSNGFLVTNNSISVGNTSVNAIITPALTTLNGSLNVTGTTNVATFNVSGLTTFESIYVVDTSSNSNLGSNITSPQLVYSFPKATYLSGKFMSVAKNGANTQMAEMVVSHDGGINSHITVYGTVSSPPGATNTSPIGLYTVGINNANVELYFTQTIASSSVKVVAHLIK